MKTMERQHCLLALRGPNLHSLDALRGGLAVYVLLGHARWLLWEGHSSWIKESHPPWSSLLAYASASLRYGHEAVICFFVLSGFFIHFRWAAARQRTTKPAFDVLDYTRRRAHRLVPPYALALLATLLFDMIGRTFFSTLYTASTGDVLLDQSFGKMYFSVESVVSALCLLPGSSGIHFGTNAPLWSLAYEFVYYAFYPIWLALRSRIGVSAYALGFSVAIGGSFFVTHAFTQGVMLMYPLWLAGAALSELVIQKQPTFRWIPVAVFFAGLGFAGFHFLTGFLVVLPYLAFGVGIVCATCSLPPTITQWRLHRTLEWVGLQSYTIYIFHFPLLAFLSAAIFWMLGGRPSSGWIAVTGSVMALAGCHFFWRIGEKNFLHARFALYAKSGQS